MPQATFRFYEELNDFLPEGKKKRDLPVSFGAGSTVRDVMASLGVPHTKVDLILVNGASVDFAHVLEGGEQVSVYPVFESFDIRSAGRPGSRPLRHLRFVADAHLGRLARYMRLFGFDTLYDQGFSAQELVKISATQGRVLLTKRRRLRHNRSLTHRILVEGDDVVTQLRGVFQRLDLYGDSRPFTRCMFCNQAVEPVSSDAVGHRRPARGQADKKELSPCASCQRIYWKGTHFDRMNQFVQEVLKEGRKRSFRGDNSVLSKELPA